MQRLITVDNTKAILHDHVDERAHAVCKTLKDTIDAVGEKLLTLSTHQRWCCPPVAGLHSAAPERAVPWYSASVDWRRSLDY